MEFESFQYLNKLRLIRDILLSMSEITSTSFEIIEDNFIEEGIDVTEEQFNEIINRVKYDIFYIENWSVLLDIKIIFITVFNTFRGDKKAY